MSSKGGMLDFFRQKPIEGGPSIGSNSEEPSSSVTQKVERIKSEVISSMIKLDEKSLSDAIAKKAQANDLNKEEIKRICELVNGAWYNHMFAQKKSDHDRDIVFDIAKPEDVVAIVSKGSETMMTDTSAKESDKESDGKIEKVASDQSFESSDDEVVKSWNSSISKFGNFTVDNDDLMRKVAHEKIADGVREIVSNAKEDVEKFEKIADIYSEAICSCEKLGFSGTDLISKTAGDAEFCEGLLKFACDAVSDKASVWVKSKMVGHGFSIKAPSSLKKTASSYSLDEYSLISKEAAEGESNIPVPVLTMSDGRSIRKYQNLVELAGEMSVAYKEAEKSTSKLNLANEKLQAIKN